MPPTKPTSEGVPAGFVSVTAGGPGAGELGGEVVFQGTTQEMIKRGQSLTAKL